MSEKTSIDSIFCAAVEIESTEEREAYLERICVHDLELRQQVERLLDAHFQGGRILDSLPRGLGFTVDQSIAEKPGTQVGPYKLLQQIGEGGMGVVHMAEQIEPIKRRVALKIIKPGMDTRQVIARFEAERQALAMMDHPNIAKVLDAGATDTGRPYFVMELVNGFPVTTYCDGQHLTPKERLELFVPICQAVQHAHQKGIIHRDLKPSNILVALYDGRPVPKIIDFGVAKAISQTLTEKTRTMFTQLGQVVGTLEYMSPEQAEPNQLDIDTRSDIYSLGAVLYELLVGDTPFDRQQLRSAAFEEMLRIIREEEPPRPSTKLSRSGSLPSIAANRHIEPQRLNLLVRGELDWIVMKALEKDRARRYETAGKFAEDVQHYLNDEPVVACPPSRAYKFRKFARRNKTLIATSSLIALTLIVGVVGTTWQAIRASIAYREVSQLAEKNLKLADQERTARKAADAARQAEASQRSTAENLAEKNKVLAENERTARQESERQLRIATAMRLAAQSQLIREKLPVQSLLLAVEAANATRNHHEPIIPLAHENLRNALNAVGGKPLAVHPGGLAAWAASVNGEWLVTAGYKDDTARLWSLAAPNRSPILLRGHESTIECAEFSKDAKRLVTISLEGMARVWEISENSAHMLFTKRLPAPSRTANFSPTGRWLGIQCRDNRVFLFDLVKATNPIALARAGSEHNAKADLIVTEDGRWLLAPKNIAPYRGVRVWRLMEESNNDIQPLSLMNGTVYPVVLSPNDRWLAGTLQNDRSTTDSDAPNTVLVWDLNKKDPRIDPVELTSATRSGRLTPLVFSSDSRTLAVGNGGNVILLSIDGESPVKTLRGQEGTIYKLAISKNGRWLATGAVDKTVRVWDLSSADPLSTAHVLRGHGQAISLLQISPTGRWLVSADDGNSLCLWDLDAPEPEATVRSLAGHETRVGFAIFSQDERWILSGGRGWDPILRLWDTSEDDAKDSIRLATIGIGQWFDRDIEMSPNGHWLAAPGKPARVWDLETVNPSASVRDLFEPGMVPDPTPSLYFDRPAALSNKWLVTTRRDHQPTLWNLTSKDVPPRKLPNDTYRIAISPDEKWLAMADEETIRLLNLSSADPSPAERRLTGHARPVQALAFSPSSRWLASGSMDNSVRIWDLSRANSSPLIINGDAPVSHLGFSPDGEWLLLRFGNGRQCTLQLCNIRLEITGKLRVITLRKDASANPSMFEYKFSPDSRWLLTSTIPTLDFRYTPQSTEIRNQAAVVELWDLSANDPAHAGVELFKTESTRTAFSPDGHWLFTFGTSRTGGVAKVWDLTSVKLMNSARILDGQPYYDAAAFDPGSRWLVTAGLQNAELWDLSMAGFESAPIVLSGHKREVRAARFTPNGRWLATASDDTTVRLYKMDENRLIEQARSQAGRELSDDETRRFNLPLTAAQQAAATFEKLSRGILLKSELMIGIQEESVSDEVRRHLLELAKGFHEEPAKLNASAWSIVADGNASKNDKERALRLVTAACKLDGKSGEYSVTLGLAQYRLEMYDAAIVSMLHANDLVTSETGLPIHLSILAMAYHQRGLTEKATETLARLKTAKETFPIAGLNRSLLQEAENLILGEEAMKKARQLNEDAWNIVPHPGRAAADYESALDRATTSNQLHPNEKGYLSTLGVTQYRVGAFEKAISSLKASNDIYYEPQAENVAFIAMAEFQLGRIEAAKTARRDLERMVANGRSGANYQRLLREANTLIDGVPYMPEVRFALQKPTPITASTAFLVQEYVHIPIASERVSWRPIGESFMLTQSGQPIRSVSTASFAEIPGETAIGKDVSDFDVAGGVLAYSEGSTIVVRGRDEGGDVVIKLESPHSSVSISPEGKHLATGNYGKEVRMWSAETGDLIRTFSVSGTIGGLRTQFSPNGEFIAVGNRNDKTCLFRVATGEKIHVLDAKMSHSLSFSPSGKSLAIAYVDGKVRIWDVGSGELVHSLSIRGQEAYAVCWSPKGDLLAAAGLEAPITIWETTDFKQLTTLNPVGYVTSLSFSPDASYLVSCGGTTKVWAVDASAK
jgi:WD40 repeat protein/serine/threonine protein kinase/tetratricopeptide (TPR) repeat protein